MLYRCASNAFKAKDSLWQSLPGREVGSPMRGGSEGVMQDAMVLEPDATEIRVKKLSAEVHEV